MNSYQDRIKKEYDSLKQKVQQIDKFIPEYIILTKTFPDFHASKIIAVINSLENTITEK